MAVIKWNLEKYEADMLEALRTQKQQEELGLEMKKE